MSAEELTRIPGIGPSTARILEQHGFDSIAAVAGADIASLAQVPGFAAARAAAVIAMARELSAPVAGEHERKPAGDRSRAHEKDKKKKKKKKGKKKKKDKKRHGKKGKGKKDKKRRKK